MCMTMSLFDIDVNFCVKVSYIYTAYTFILSSILENAVEFF